MFVFRGPIVRNSFLIMITIVVLFCIHDRIFDLLSGAISVFEKTETSLPDTSAETPIDKNETKRELVLLQMLFRHGHRAPFMLYPYDANSQLLWPEGLGMLTQLGRLQHYVMGSYLKDMYKGFITTNPKEVEVVNSDNFRCQYAVYSFIAGFYSPTEEYSFTDELQWQPIISRHAGYKGKNLLTRGACPIADNESRMFKNSAQANATKEKYRDLYNFWSVNSGRLIDGWSLAGDLGKTLACEKDYNFTIPEWGLKFWDEFSDQVGISYYFNYGTKLIQRYRIGPLLGYMIEQINEKILGEIPEKRVFLYAAHGSNIACLMLALDLYDWKGPPYASTVVLELWKEDDVDYSIRWLYFNSSNPEKKIDPPVVLRIDGCDGDFCPLGRFADIVKRLVPDDWAEECNDTSQQKRFEPFESPIHVPGLSSSSSPERISIRWVITGVLLFISFYHKN